ncbi:MIP family channel protein [soil metagenome]
MMAKRYGAECLGTFVIVFAPLAASANGADLTVSALVSGLAVLAMVYALGPISAAHFNPAVSLGFASVGRFPLRSVLPYWLCQFGGAILAAGVGAILFGAGHGAHIPTSASVVRNVGTELVLTFILMLVIAAVATDRRAGSTVPGISIGLTVVLGVLVGGPVTGGSMNPARSFGPALFANSAARSSLWLYLAVPLAGAVLAAKVYEALRLHPEHATGAPNELLEALSAIRAEERGP